MVAKKDEHRGYEVLKHCGDDASKWAAEFRATAIKLGYSDMDEGWLIGWFANAIEHSGDVRRWRKTATAIGELKPCPFCGNARITVCLHPALDETIDGVSVECADCTARVLALSEDQATAAWNTRAILQAEKEVIK